MSPYPAQITRDGLVAQAWDIAARDGVESLSLARLADALGVKAPSLYNHMKGKAELLKAVNELTIRRLFDTLDAIAASYPPESAYASLLAMAAAYRTFAHTHPIPYTLAFATTDPTARPDPAELAARAIPYQHRMAYLSGDEASLTALRGLLALMHGYVMLELHHQLQRGGDLAATYMQLVGQYLNSWEKRDAESGKQKATTT
jgi:AcrR family transcriptional regulator